MSARGPSPPRIGSLNRSRPQLVIRSQSAAAESRAGSCCTNEQIFSLQELASAVDLNPAAASRVVRALEEAAIVRDTRSDTGGRRRSIGLLVGGKAGAGDCRCSSRGSGLDVRIVTPTRLVADAADVLTAVRDDVVVVGAAALEVALVDAASQGITPTRSRATAR